MSDTCVAKVYERDAWSRNPSRLCGKAAKDTIDGQSLCGIHARAERTRRANDELRQQEENARRAAESLGAENSANVCRSKVGHHSDPSKGVVDLDVLERLRFPT